MAQPIQYVPDFSFFGQAGHVLGSMVKDMPELEELDTRIQSDRAYTKEISDFNQNLIKNMISDEDSAAALKSHLGDDYVNLLTKELESLKPISDKEGNIKERNQDYTMRTIRFMNNLSQVPGLSLPTMGQLSIMPNVTDENRKSLIGEIKNKKFGNAIQDFQGDSKTLQSAAASEGWDMNDPRYTQKYDDMRASEKAAMLESDASPFEKRQWMSDNKYQINPQENQKLFDDEVNHSLGEFVNIINEPQNKSLKIALSDPSTSTANKVSMVTEQLGDTMDTNIKNHIKTMIPLWMAENSNDAKVQAANISSAGRSRSRAAGAEYSLEDFAEDSEKQLDRLGKRRAQLEDDIRQAKADKDEVRIQRLNNELQNNKLAIKAATEISANPRKYFTEGIKPSEALSKEQLPGGAIPTQLAAEAIQSIKNLGDASLLGRGNFDKRIAKVVEKGKGIIDGVTKFTASNGNEVAAIIKDGQVVGYWDGSLGEKDKLELITNSPQLDRDFQAHRQGVSSAFKDQKATPVQQALERTKQEAPFLHGGPTVALDVLQGMSQDEVYKTYGEFGKITVEDKDGNRTVIDVTRMKPKSDIPQLSPEGLRAVGLDDMTQKTSDLQPSF